MSMHTTNYFNTFIAVAEDCSVPVAEVPGAKENPTVAELQYKLLNEGPYELTSDDVLFKVHAQRQGIPKSEWKEAREVYFSKGQACMRASPLTKRYGFGVHSDDKGRIALVPLGTKAYTELSKDPDLKQVRAMRSKRA